VIALVCAGVLAVVNAVLFALGVLPIRDAGIPNWTQTLVVLAGVVMTIAIFSFLYKDNPFFRAAEHLFVGLGLGISLVVLWYEFYKPDIYDALVVPAFTKGMTVGHDKLILLIPIGLGLMVLLRMSRSYAWVSRYPLAFLVGYGMGFGIQPVIHSNILKQMKPTLEATPMPWFGWAIVGMVAMLLLLTAYFASKGGRLATYLKIASGTVAVAYVIARATERFGQSPEAVEAFASMDKIIIILGVFSVLCYFVFSLEHKGAVGAVSRVGIIFLMLAFGASFGYAVMARESLLIGRFQFLLGDWLHLLR